jgi:hypothetical protein
LFSDFNVIYFLISRTGDRNGLRDFSIALYKEALLVCVIAQYQTFVNKNKDAMLWPSQQVLFLLQLGLFAHPIYSSEGDYPQTVRKLLDKVSVAQGYNRSQLRHFSPEEVSNIRGK